MSCATLRAETTRHEKDCHKFSAYAKISVLY